MYLDISRNIRSMDGIIMEKILNKNVTELKINKSIKEILLNNNINSIYNICTYSRMELTEIGLNNVQVNDIIVALQLLGLDLKRNRSRKNTLVEKYM